jgi:hypothetical protein
VQQHERKNSDFSGDTERQPAKQDIRIS